MKAFAYFIDQNMLRYALVEKRGKEFAVLRTGSITGENKIIESLPSILSELGKEDQIVSFIRSKKCYYSTFSFPFTSLSKLQKALPFQLESIPYNQEERIDAVLLLSKTRGSREVGVFSCSKQEIAQSMARDKEFGLEIDRLTEQSFCHLKFLQSQGIRDAFILDTYLEDASLTLIKEGKYVEALTLPLKNMGAYLERGMTFLSSKYFIEIQFPLYLFGLSPPLNTPSLYLSYPYGSQIGAAIDALKEKDSPSVQFCTSIFTPKKQRDQLVTLWMKNLGALFVCSLLFLGGISLLKMKESHKIQKELKERLGEVKLQGIAQKVQERTFSELSSTLEEIEYDLTKVTPFYNRAEKPFLVSSFIDWLSKKSHLETSSIEPVGHRNPAPPRGRLDAHNSSQESLLLEESPPLYGGVIQSMSYELVDYPNAGAPKKPYKIEIALVLTTLSAAEILKEALLKDFSKQVKNIEVKNYEDTYQVKFNLS